MGTFSSAFSAAFAGAQESSGRVIGETNTQKVLRILLSPAASLESAMRQVLLLRGIGTAVGVQLDVLGAIVGRAREGEPDDEIYRRYVRAQITTNKSDGTINTILKVAGLVVSDPSATFTLHNYGIATYSLEVSGIALTEAVAQVLVRMIIKATAGGVRAIVEYATSDADDVFRYDVGPGFDVGHYSTAVDHEF